MGYGHNKFDVTGTLTTDLLLGYLDTTTVADNALVADALILATGTLVVLGRTEDALAEQTVTLGLVGTIVDGLGLSHLTIRTFENFLWRCQTNGNLGEIRLYL